MLESLVVCCFSAEAREEAGEDGEHGSVVRLVGSGKAWKMLDVDRVSAELNWFGANTLHQSGPLLMVNGQSACEVLDECRERRTYND